MTLRGSWDDFGNSNLYGNIISPTEDILIDGLAFQKPSLTLNYTTSSIFPSTTSADDTYIPLDTIAAIRVEDEKVYLRISTLSFLK